MTDGEAMGETINGAFELIGEMIRLEPPGKERAEHAIKFLDLINGLKPKDFVINTSWRKANDEEGKVGQGSGAGEALQKSAK
jgi:hypothetical protein